MNDDVLTLEEALGYAMTVIRGMHAELRAMRLEQRALLGKLSESDTATLNASLIVADEVADMLDSEDSPPPADVRMLS